MAVQVFDKSDKKYQDWLSNHQTGHVLSMGRNRDEGFIAFHKASCFFISQYTDRYSFGAFTQRGYIKICADTPNELHTWVRENIRGDGKFTKICSKCNPIDSARFPTSEIQNPDEVSQPSNYFEGATKTVSVNVYERDRKARDASVAHYGAACLVCGIDFGSVYGELGEGFIHVHHLTPLSRIKRGYSPDPIKDLQPVCPNCHSMIHTEDPPISIETLREIIGKGAKGPKKKD